MSDTTTILKEAAKLWFDNLSHYEEQITLMKNNFRGVLITDEWKLKCYIAENPTKLVQEFEKDNEEAEIPFEIKKQFIEAAKNISCIDTPGIIINNPDIYKYFRAGQNNAYAILKADYPSDSIQSMNEEYVKLKNKNEKLIADNKELFLWLAQSKDNVKLLREALGGIINSWSERMGGDIEVKKDGSDYNISEYWSPAASLVSSEFIAAGRTALEQTK